MPLKPVTEYVGGVGPRQRVWDAIRLLAATEGVVFTERDILSAVPRKALADVDLSAIRDYRRGLVAAGILVVAVEGTARNAAAYRLAVDSGIEAPRVRRDGTRVTTGLAQEQMWRTLRMLPTEFNARELASYASTPENPVSEVAAADYLGNLNRAGYLIVVSVGKGNAYSSQRARYRLDPRRNSGPKPPMVCRTHVVYDPNLGRVVWQPPVSEETAIYG
ncbi:hypothetical protein [Rhodocyclus tenuis]|uniref:Uncharacterized protein n=1 Tax=Rhodocyclus tenuis TaxID=1066 RepID=A0A840G5W7_RHOTE|nr:hypothetical protein [Rhodocyclus tenuis]MBB4247285.1 hypothetical protein [Rhodocyclus tenuis]